MKIFRTADAKVPPSWIFETDATNEFEKNTFINSDEIKRISIASADAVTEDILTRECDYIDECVAEKKPYHYNDAWSEKDINHLREYAMASGLSMDAFRKVTVSKYLPKESSSNDIIKTASSKSSSIDIGDIFGLAQLEDQDEMVRENWETVKDASKLRDKPSIISNSIRPVRGGEDYFTNSESKSAPGQNSLDDPDAIERLAKSETEDTGARLKREKAEREEAKSIEHKDWEQSVIQSMTQKDIIPHGKVFPTEVMNAQPGLNTPSSQKGVYANFDVNSIPEKTAGEKIAEQNESRRQSIQRTVEKDDWERPNRQSSRMVSDDLAEALAKNLKKNKDTK